MDSTSAIILLVLGSIFFLYWIYEYKYFNSQQFTDLCLKFDKYVLGCNQLNDYIGELKSYDLITKLNYGEATLNDTSIYNYKRAEQVNFKKHPYVYECSATVCKNAEQQPFKYLCKYFNIDISEETLEYFEKKLNDFTSVEEGKASLVVQLEYLKQNIRETIPKLISTFRMNKVLQNMGFKEIDIKDTYFPTYTFKYISPGGNKSTECNIVLDVKNLNLFVEYLYSVIKFKKSQKAQRSLMTSKLRTKIKERDNYTCQCCGISTKDEPHLLIEIDHIISIAKGGLTTESNLQALCWQCNRSKGSK